MGGCVSLNFGSFFEKMLGTDLRDIAGKASKTMNSYATSFSKVNEDIRKNINETADDLKKVSKALKDYNDKIEELDRTVKDGTKTEEERLRAAIQKENIEKRLLQVEDEHIVSSGKLKVQTSGLSQSSAELGKKLEDMSKLTFANVKMNTAKMYEEFNKTGKATSSISGQTLNSFEDIEKENFGQKVASSFNLIGGSFEDLGKNSGMADSATDMFSSGLKAIFPELGGLNDLIAEGLTKAITKAIAQITQLNETIVGLTRSTGGVVKGMSLGTDAFGNVLGTMHSLQTEAIGANVSMEQFGDAVNNLMSEGLGAGAQFNMSAGDLKTYGLEAARFSKMFGADISGTVRNMFLNFGKPIGEVAASLSDASKVAEAAGLSVKEFVKNLQDVTAMSGETYFKGGIDAMEDMAMTATRLGTSVRGLTDGLKNMNTLTDVFTQQQKAAAMGMHTLGSNMSKIFALKQAGRSGEAANLRLSSAAQDLQAQGMFDKKTGSITQQGMATAQGMGMSEEDIKNMQKAIIGAKKVGVSLETYLGPKSKMTKAVKKSVEEQEKANMTLTERWDVATKSFMQSFIDPIADLLTPIIDSLMSAFEGLLKVLTPIAKYIMSALITPLKFFSGLISELASTVGSVFSDIGDKLSDLWKKVEPAFSKIGEVFSWIGHMVGKVMAAPFKILGWVVGKLIDGISVVVDIFILLWDKTKKVLSFFETLGSKLWGNIKAVGSKILDAVLSPFRSLWKLIKGILQPFIDIFKQITDGFKGWANKWPLSVLFGKDEISAPKQVMSNAEAVQAMTNNQIAANLQSQSTPAMQNLNPSSAIAQPNTATAAANNTAANANQSAAAAVPPKVVIQNDVKTTPGIVTSKNIMKTKVTTGN